VSEEQINIKIVQMVEKFPVIYDYSSLGCFLSSGETL
jgi:hypothetical protein